jgi:hypothetical protein
VNSIFLLLFLLRDDKACDLSANWCMCVVFGSLQGVDYLKYDNCNNGDLKPLKR